MVFQFSLSLRSFKDQADKTAAKSGWELVSCTHGRFWPIILCLLLKCKAMVIQPHIFVFDSVPDDWFKAVPGWEKSCFWGNIQELYYTYRWVSHLSWLKIHCSSLRGKNPPQNSVRAKTPGPVQTNADRWHISPRVRFVLMGDPRRWRSPLTQTPAGDCLHLGPVKVINDDRSGHTVNSVQSVWWIARSRCGLSQVC